MKQKMKILLGILLTVVLFSGCKEELEEYNKPALYWYSSIVKSISSGNMDKADNAYASLQGEHIGSPLLPEATMILAMSHMYYEEYLLTEHFLNEYIKRYANSNEREFAEFLKIKAKYLSLPHPRRDQEFIKELIVDANAFKKKYPNSSYYSTVDSLLSNLYISEALLNQIIASLYERLDKPKAAAYYKNLNPQPWIDYKDVQYANIPWYREWFEGDGSESWYAFMLPDTQSVVSRNSVKDTIEKTKGE